jgi:hypothetical protein
MHEQSKGRAASGDYKAVEASLPAILPDIPVPFLKS